MMGKLQKNEAGFSAVEVVLVVVIVALIGVVGYMVYKNHHKTATAAVTTTAKTTTTKPATTTKTTTTAPATTTVKVPDLGIEIVNVPTSIADLTYNQNTSDASYTDPNNTSTSPVSLNIVQFSTTTLTTADSACSASGSVGIGTLSRTGGTYVNNQTQDNTAFVKQFSGFYITYSHPESQCSNNSTTEALHTAQTATFDTLVTNAANLEAIQ